MAPVIRTKKRATKADNADLAKMPGLRFTDRIAYATIKHRLIERGILEEVALPDDNMPSVSVPPAPVEVEEDVDDESFYGEDDEWDEGDDD